MIYFPITVVDCQWDDWTDCKRLKCRGDGLSPSIAEGLKSRTVRVPAKLGGKECKGRNTEHCTAPCPGILLLWLPVFDLLEIFI